MMDRAEDYNSEKDVCVEDSLLQPVEDSSLQPVEDSSLQPVEDSSLQPVEDSSLQPVTSEKNHSLNEECSANKEMSSDTSDQERSIMLPYFCLKIL